MRLISTEIGPSPLREAQTRISGRLELATNEFHTVWYDVPDEIAGDLSNTANPWLIVMLPFALQRGGTIETDLPADATLLENLRGLIAVWRSWYSFLRPVTIAAKAARLEVEAKKNASFFSGGVDSWFTALRYTESLSTIPSGRVDEFITVSGLDIPLSAATEFERLIGILLPSANAMGKKLIRVTTNIHENYPGSFWRRLWPSLTHGAGLASIALILERRYQKVILGSSYQYGRLFPWGSHPLTDVLLSSSRTQIIHDGAMYSRVEKTEFIARSDLALKGLRVCLGAPLVDNCCRCEKCYRTMAALELIGVMDRCPTFPKGFSVELLAKTYAKSRGVRYHLSEVRDAARERGRADLVRAIDASLLRSRLLHPLIAATWLMQKWPFVWRYGAPLRSRLLRGAPS